MIVLKQFLSKEQMFDELAENISERLIAALTNRSTALVVSGGTTPQPLFERLSEVTLDWRQVTVVPSDERWLATDHAASNENLIRSSLLQNQAASAGFQGLKLDYEQAEDAEAELNAQLVPLLDSYAVAVIGMGLDGHFASIFPGTKVMDDALASDSNRYCYAVDATGCAVAGEYTERMTLSLAAILEAQQVFLLITGAEKLALIEQVMKKDPEVMGLPIAHLLHQNHTAVTVCCA